MTVTRKIDHALYPRKALADARKAYRNHISLQIHSLNDDSTKLDITVRPEYSLQGNTVILEFLNYLLDCAAEAHFEEIDSST